MAQPDQPTPQPQPHSVELRPHIGRMPTKSGEVVEVEHSQWIVFADVGYWRGQIGYLGKSPGSRMACVYEVRKVAALDRDAVFALVSEAAGWDVAPVLPFGMQ